MQPYKAWIVTDTIDKNKPVFKIPVYQRNYDWTNIQCEKLFNDIIDAFKKQKKHLEFKKIRRYLCCIKMIKT